MLLAMPAAAAEITITSASPEAVKLDADDDATYPCVRSRLADK